MTNKQSAEPLFMPTVPPIVCDMCGKSKEPGENYFVVRNLVMCPRCRFASKQPVFTVEKRKKE